MAEETDRAAKALIAAGIEPGETVALWLPNSPTWIFLMFALARIGVMQIPVNTRLRSEEIGYVLTQSNCGTLITTGQSGTVDLLAVARGWLKGGSEGEAPRAPRLRRIVTVGAQSSRPTRGGPEAVEWEALLAAREGVSSETLARRAAAVDPDAPLFMMYTSGTTGFPKGVVHNHNILRNVEDRANRLGITQADVILMNLPLFHIMGYGEGPLLSLVSGARLVLTETFDPTESLAAIEGEGVTVMNGFDTHFKDLIAAQERAPRDMSSLRLAFCVAGMHSSAPVAYRANELFCPTYTGYGMTEVYVGACLSFPASSLEQRCESSGFPAPGYEFRVVDLASGAALPPGVPGELWVRGYGVMLGYHDKPEETARTIDPDGWLHSGDLCVWRDDGYLRFIGRIKDMLKVGGENVDPMEVEGYLLGHPGIREVAVVGAPDERLGEVPAAFVQPEPGAKLTPGEVTAHCKGKIASFKSPRHVFLVEDFPMTSSGKIQKAKLREMLPELLRGGRG